LKEEGIYETKNSREIFGNRALLNYFKNDSTTGQIYIWLSFLGSVKNISKQKKIRRHAEHLDCLTIEVYETCIYLYELNVNKAENRSMDNKISLSHHFPLHFTCIVWIKPKHFAIGYVKFICCYLLLSAS
jgi:hypothetical protein